MNPWFSLAQADVDCSYWTALIVSFCSGTPPLKGPTLMRKLRTYSPDSKARVPMEAISECKAIQEIVADHANHLIQVIQLSGSASVSSTMFRLNSYTGDCLNPFCPECHWTLIPNCVTRSPSL